MLATYLTTAEAANELGVSPSWIAALCRNGGLSARQESKGAPWRILLSSVQKLAKKKRASDPSELGVNQCDLEDVAKEIKESQEVQKAIEKKVEASLYDTVLGIANKYGTDVTAAVAGVVGGIFLPGNPVTPILIGEAILGFIRKIFGRKQSSI